MSSNRLQQQRNEKNAERFGEFASELAMGYHVVLVRGAVCEAAALWAMREDYLAKGARAANCRAVAEHATATPDAACAEA